MKLKPLTLAIALGVIIMVPSILVGNTMSDFPPDPDGGYSPWGDLNDDGSIDIFDIVWLAQRYDTIGIPVNKTALLYNINETFAELLAKIEDFNSTVIEQQSIINNLNNTVNHLNNTVINLNHTVSYLNNTVIYLNETILEFEGNGSLSQILYSSGASVSFTPTSSLHNVVIIAKGYAYIGGTIVHLWGQAYLKDGGTTLDQVTYGFTYDHGPADLAFDFCLEWSGHLSETTHQIQITKTAGNLGLPKILILEFTPIES